MMGGDDLADQQGLRMALRALQSVMRLRESRALVDDLLDRDTLAVEDVASLAAALEKTAGTSAEARTDYLVTERMADDLAHPAILLGVPPKREQQRRVNEKMAAAHGGGAVKTLLED